MKERTPSQIKYTAIMIITIFAINWPRLVTKLFIAFNILADFLGIKVANKAGKAIVDITTMMLTAKIMMLSEKARLASNVTFTAAKQHSPFTAITLLKPA